MLTKKQLELLIFLEKKIAHSAIPPSFEEMKSALNLKSKSGIHRLISALEERGTHAAAEGCEQDRSGWRKCYGKYEQADSWQAAAGMRAALEVVQDEEACQTRPTKYQDCHVCTTACKQQYFLYWRVIACAIQNL